jgi:hypothetical protein
VAGTCEYGKEPSGSIKCGEFLGYAKTGQLLKKDSAPWSKYRKDFRGTVEKESGSASVTKITS